MKQELRTYISFYRGSKTQIILSFFLTLIQTASILPVALIIKYLFEFALPNGDSMEFFIGLCIVLVLLVLNAAAILANRHITLKIIKLGTAKMRQQLIEKTLSLECGFYATEDLDAIHSHIVQDTERLDIMTSAILTQLLPGVGIIIGLLCLLTYFNALLVLIMIGVLPILYLVGKFLGDKVQKSVSVFHTDFSEFSKGVQFVLKFNELITSSTAEKYEINKQKQNIQNLQSSSRIMAWISTAYGTIQGNVLIFGGICSLFIGGLQVIHHTISIGSLLSFYVALDFLSNHARTVSIIIPSLIEGKESLRALMPLFASYTAQDGKKITGFNNNISFKNVYFDYGTHFKLEDVVVTINKHDVVGLFGSSGSGKSTLINLLLGFYRPKRGNIFIDNENLADLDMATYRKKIGVLPQEPLLFPGTIIENLTYGLESVNEEEVRRVCAECAIHDFILDLPDGYNSNIGNRGVKLSGGQRQRIAIARAVLRSPEILILDEPDKNLDDSLIFEIIEKIRQRNITLIIISHNKQLRSHVTRSLLIQDGVVNTLTYEQ